MYEIELYIWLGYSFILIQILPFDIGCEFSKCTEIAFWNLLIGLPAFYTPLFFLKFCKLPNFSLPRAYLLPSTLYHGKLMADVFLVLFWSLLNPSSFSCFSLLPNQRCWYSLYLFSRSAGVSALLRLTDRSVYDFQVRLAIYLNQIAQIRSIQAVNTWNSQRHRINKLHGISES